MIDRARITRVTLAAITALAMLHPLTAHAATAMNDPHPMDASSLLTWAGTANYSTTVESPWGSLLGPGYELRDMSHKEPTTNVNFSIPHTMTISQNDTTTADLLSTAWGAVMFEVMEVWGTSEAATHYKSLSWQPSAIAGSHNGASWASPSSSGNGKYHDIIDFRATVVPSHSTRTGTDLMFCNGLTYVAQMTLATGTRGTDSHFDYSVVYRGTLDDGTRASWYGTTQTVDSHAPWNPSTFTLDDASAYLTSTNDAGTWYNSGTSWHYTITQKHKSAGWTTTDPQDIANIQAAMSSSLNPSSTADGLPPGVSLPAFNTWVSDVQGIASGLSSWMWPFTKVASWDD